MQSGAETADEQGCASSTSLEDLGSGDSFLRALAAMPVVAPEASEPDRCGQRLGPYHVSSKIGEGGMGIVYLAEDTRLMRTVALKVLPVALVSNDERRKRFLREARAASAVQHPNVASVFDVGEAEGTVYIAMEHVEGRTLRRLIEQAERPLEVETALRIALDISRALQRAHEAGVVHRDVKPENVVVMMNGTVKVLDFGLAKSTGWREKAETEVAGQQNDLVSKYGRVLGTPGYMSPEQAAGEPVDARTDVYALGVVLHELLFGVRPEGAARRSRRPPFSTTRALLGAVAKKCLREDARERYPSAREVADRLARIGERRPQRLLGRFAIAGLGAAGGALAAGYLLAASGDAPLPPPPVAVEAEPTEAPLQRPRSTASSPEAGVTAPSNAPPPPLPPPQQSASLGQSTSAPSAPPRRVDASRRQIAEDPLATQK